MGEGGGGMGFCGGLREEWVKTNHHPPKSDSSLLSKKSSLPTLDTTMSHEYTDLPKGREG